MIFPSIIFTTSAFFNYLYLRIRSVQPRFQPTQLDRSLFTQITSPNSLTLHFLLPKNPNPIGRSNRGDRGAARAQPRHCGNLQAEVRPSGVQGGGLRCPEPGTFPSE